ncbi:MAG: hypothetical protein ACRDJU_11655, partial [Actinomycetota bacterium]
GWRTVASAASLAAAPAGRPCGLEALTAVGYLDGTPIAGGDCRRAGSVGLFIERGGSWSPAGLALPPAMADRRAGVLGLEGAGQGVTAVVALAGSDSVDLLAAWTTAPGAAWTLSSPHPLPPAARLVSISPAGSQGLCVLVATRSGAFRLFQIGAEAPRWRSLPAPPAGTAVVAPGPSASLTALAARGALLSVWTLPAGSATWTESQTMPIGVPYGSSG